MKNKVAAGLLALLSLGQVSGPARAPQGPPASDWRSKQCAVVLTYDDALGVDLDHVLPALDSARLRGTFYVIGTSPVVQALKTPLAFRLPSKTPGAPLTSGWSLLVRLWCAVAGA